MRGVFSERLTGTQHTKRAPFVMSVLVSIVHRDREIVFYICEPGNASQQFFMTFDGQLKLERRFATHGSCQSNSAALSL